jgi:hypothetical protein
MLDVRVAGQPALGSVVTATNQPVTIDVTVTSADWAAIDTLEVFANTTPDGVDGLTDTTLVPLKCWTSRPLDSLAATDPCARASLAPEAMTVTLATVAGGFQRFTASVQVTLDAADIATRAGATGKDAWLVFRARGDTGIFPILTQQAVDATTMPALMSGDLATIRAALSGKGVPAQAVTAPIFVDFDGGGYRAPFAP